MEQIRLTDELGPCPGRARDMSRGDMPADGRPFYAMMERSGWTGGGRAGDGTGQAGELRAGRVGGQGQLGA